MSAIDFLHVTPQDDYEAVSVGDAPRKSESRLVRGLRETLRAAVLTVAAVGIMAALIALRLLAFPPASLHLYG
ncbi:MAG TPA: hypothetical protein VMU06_00150 [Stellaceae bacterium]|nr:hypothetical protein [Stellaceae bacterium]